MTKGKKREKTRKKASYRWSLSNNDEESIYRAPNVDTFNNSQVNWKTHSKQSSHLGRHSQN